jgi:hypothetical protein
MFHDLRHHAVVSYSCKVSPSLYFDAQQTLHQSLAPRQSNHGGVGQRRAHVQPIAAASVALEN